MLLHFIVNVEQNTKFKNAQLKLEILVITALITMTRNNL